MIEFIRVQRFKTLMDASFPLAGLNIFSGLNGMGKSSLLQVLLLLRQSFERHMLLDKGLLLKGDYVSLGTGQDILAEQADNESIEFLIKWKDISPIIFNFNYAAENELQPLNKKEIPQVVDYEVIKKRSLFNQNFQYLSADRISPKTSYEISDYYISELNSLGNHGEYTIHYIAEYGTKAINIQNLKHENSISNSLIENLDCWMSEITPSIRIHASLQRQLNSVSLCYAFSNEKNITADFKPQNVGFGLTYVLPVVTAIIRAKPGDLLIIENPESHLHPSGQSILGKLCALAAKGGVQLFIESHSDHFINGVRVAVKEGFINNADVHLFYLERNSSKQHSSNIISPEINENGRINIWPQGFFDEADKQLEKLL